MTNTVSYTAALQNQKAVTAYLKSKQLLPFDFAQQNCPSSCDKKYRYKECHLGVKRSLLQTTTLCRQGDEVELMDYFAYHACLL